VMLTKPCHVDMCSWHDIVPTVDVKENKTITKITIKITANITFSLVTNFYDNEINALTVIKL
jgi:hypothetical protein